MNKQIVMTIIAKDRPGLVELISARVAGCGGNWEESQMSRLGGHFAGILKINVDEERIAELLTVLESLNKQAIKVIINEDVTPEKEAKVIPMKIGVIGQDHPGIIRDLSMVLFKHDANVEALHTELQSEPHSGNALFVASIKLILPPTGNVDQLKLDLENVAADLMVDIDLTGES